MSNLPGVKHQRLLMHDNTLCVKIFSQNGYFQLFIESADALKDDSNLYIYIPLNLESDVFAKNIELLQSIVNHKIEVECKEEQYLGLLKTIDDRKQGFSHRDIASEIFGKELVKMNGLLTVGSEQNPLSYKEGECTY